MSAGVRSEDLGIAGLRLLIPVVHRDARGFFFESYSRRSLASIGIEAEFVQDNHSRSTARGVIRGLHFQIPPHQQDKLVHVVRGAILDVAVDLRKGSPTFARHASVVLSAENAGQIFVPAGFAHGFCTLEPDTDVIYKVTDYHAPDCDKGVAFDDPALGIDWPVAPQAAIVSDRDRRHPRLAELPDYFIWRG